MENIELLPKRRALSVSAVPGRRWPWGAGPGPGESLLVSPRRVAGGSSGLSPTMSRPAQDYASTADASNRQTSLGNVPFNRELRLSADDWVELIVQAIILDGKHSPRY